MRLLEAHLQVSTKPVTCHTGGKTATLMLDTEPVRMALVVKAPRILITQVMDIKRINTSQVDIVSRTLIANQVLTVSLAAIASLAMIPDMITTHRATALGQAIRLILATRLHHTASTLTSNRVMSLLHGALTIQMSLEIKMQMVKTSLFPLFSPLSLLSFSCFLIFLF